MFTYAHVKWFYGQSERAYYLNYFIKFDCASVLHIPIVHAHDVSKQIRREKKIENVIKQLVHTSAVRSSRYEALGKFGEHSRS